ncbi:GNAT family N-acetyltransferase [Aquimarina agarilytica]|uniref:GNAT family N-acetyltransferase n=1 Tax=Aquimarina agarilytica TaxID=1087449 RepID=UPI0002895666|nr:GNAT family N-acetyltransferase [Aquimarina agarilytica]
MILENERVRLIPFNIYTAKGLNEIIFDDTIWEFMGHYIRNKKDLDNYINSTLQAKNNHTAIPFLVVDKDYGALAGCTRFGKIDTNNKRAEIGWTWYGTRFWGTGLNTATKALLLDFGFTNLRLNRIQFGADTRNIRSQKAIEKLGATKEGIRRNHYIDNEGISRHDVYYAITKEDWQNKQQLLASPKEYVSEKVLCF